MLDDLRFTLRSWAKAPAFAIVAILTLTLGLAAATAIFSVVDSVLLRPLPYPNASRIVDLREVDEKAHSMRVAEPNFADLQERSRSFEVMAKYAREVQAVTGGSEPVRAAVCLVSGQFFRVLGVQPEVGRPLSDDPRDRGVVVSAGFWKKVLGAKPDLDGIFVHFANETFPVIGILPDGSGFPVDTDIWCPAAIYPSNASRTAHNWDAIARLRPDVLPGQAKAELSQIGRDLKSEYGSDIDACGFTVAPVGDRMVKDVRAILLVLCGAVGLLLFIAAFNVTNLVLVRTILRQREIALRVALGASRARLFRQFLSEALLLTFLGGALGAVAAKWTVRVMIGLYHGDLPRFASTVLTVPILLYSLGGWIFLALFLASVPFWSGRLRKRQQRLQDPGRMQSSSRSETRARSSLVMAQIGLTLTLLIGAGLLGRSLQRLLSVQPGFNPESTVAMIVSRADPADSEGGRQLARFHSNLMDRLKSIPGVVATGGVESLPLTGGTANGTFIIEEDGKAAQTIDDLSKEIPAAIAAGRSGDAIFHIASGNYFKVMQIPLIRGRSFEEADGPENSHVALITESLARRYFAGRDPIGKQIQFGNMDGDLHLLTIIGLVGDIRDRALEGEPHPTVYVNYIQRAMRAGEFTFVLKGHADAATLIKSMRQEAIKADAQMPIKFVTLNQIVSSSLDTKRFGLVMVGSFAGAALLLAMVGLYGIMAYITAERTTEVGIRMALGAQRGDILRLVLSQSFCMVALGAIAGLLLALGTSRLLGSLLYAVSPTDPTYISVVLLLGVVAFAATYIPAWRASRTEPIVALRHE